MHIIVILIGWWFDAYTISNLFYKLLKFSIYDGSFNSKRRSFATSWRIDKLE